ncbi:phosphonate ABC transporter, permease protein PhnE, partial [Salmonella enterica subsp. enterica]|nr:phosphonate ABC transporter, permease protein PhnE [Salmonella enterica subsp. enterica serovar Anatum]
MNTNFEAILSEQRQSWNRVVRYVILILAIVVGCWYYVGLFDGERLGEGVPSLVSLIGEMFPPNFSEWRAWVKPVLDTLAMSIAGTAIAVLLSVPLGILAARNTSPHPAVYQAARALLNVLRSVPELIMGIVFVAAVGFGALPGVLALGLHSIGMIAKF